MEDTSVESVAVQFVDLALKYGNRWGEVNELPKVELQVLLATVHAAGFDPMKLVPEKLKGHYLDEDMRRTGETYPINRLCPFKVVNQEGGDDYSATGWLDCAVHRVVSGGESREQLINVIRSEIERSVPLQPIQLTPEGDLLREYPRQGYFVDHTRDSDRFESCVGIHKHCGGWVDRRGATKTHDALLCRGCHLRVLFPKEISTYGELRQALASRFVQVPA